MRQRGLEPPRYCYRQPLKLVRLPVPPLPHMSSKASLAAMREARNQIEMPQATFSEAAPDSESAAAVVASPEECLLLELRSPELAPQAPGSSPA